MPTSRKSQTLHIVGAVLLLWLSVILISTAVLYTHVVAHPSMSVDAFFQVNTAVVGNNKNNKNKNDPDGRINAHRLSEVSHHGGHVLKLTANATAADFRSAVLQCLEWLLEDPQVTVSIVAPSREVLHTDVYGQRLLGWHDQSSNLISVVLPKTTESSVVSA